ncbi:MAG TPA: hypothetical protein VJS42_07800 [Steroidobacteraceae bacterium]|nr:hypothetical protein [Steroidobacteraceae bacterium]
MKVQIKCQQAFAGTPHFSHFPLNIPALCVVATLCLSGSVAYAACEREIAAVCSQGDPRCLDGAAKSVEQAANDCKTPEGRNQYASLWQATPSFFDNAPHEHEFWRCVAQQCNPPPQPGK